MRTVAGHGGRGGGGGGGQMFFCNQVANHINLGEKRGRLKCIAHSCLRATSARQSSFRCQLSDLYVFTRKRGRPPPSHLNPIGRQQRISILHTITHMLSANIFNQDRCTHSAILDVANCHIYHSVSFSNSSRLREILRITQICLFLLPIENML